jgi:membrane protein DedA with SNARE-associated domain
VPDASPLDLIGEWTMGVIQDAGYPGLALLVTLEMVFPPIPSELVLPLAGFLTGQGLLLYPLAVLAATLGSVVGALLLYGVGRTVGERRIRALTRRYGKWLLMDERDLDRARAWFDRYDAAAVFLGRLAPGVRSLVSIPAGVAGMPIGRFAWYTALGSGLWNAGLIGLGWLLGAHWETATDYLRPLTVLVVAGLGAAGLVLAWKRIGDRVLRRGLG